MSLQAKDYKGLLRENWLEVQEERLKNTDIEERSGHSPARPAALKATTELELPSHMDGRSFQTAS